MPRTLTTAAIVLLATLPQDRATETDTRSPLATQIAREEARRHYQAGDPLNSPQALSRLKRARGGPPASR